MTDRVVLHGRQTIRVGSKSFFAAARLFDPPTRESAYMLYAWCRYCDDRIDLQELGHGRSAASAASGRERLAELEHETRRATAGERIDDPVFRGLQRVVETHRIPHHLPLELLEGFRMDVEGHDYATLDDTLRYCYHVAGVVGVMMARVMGVSDEATLDRAADLGLAFQMTNIARDVIDDARAGRLYLPREWIDETGLAPEEILGESNRAALFAVTRRLLLEADRYYDSSRAGIARLRTRHAWAIAGARRVYRDIGRLVLERGERAWDRRAIVGLPRKLALLLAAGAEAVRLTRLSRRSTMAPREALWTRPRRESP